MCAQGRHYTQRGLLQIPEAGPKIQILVAEKFLFFP